MSYYRHKLPRTGYGLGAGGQQTVNDKIQSYPVISTSLISTSRYLDINLWSRQKQSLFNVKLPGYLDISILTTRYRNIISNPLEEKLNIWHFKICKKCKIKTKTSKFIKDLFYVTYLFYIILDFVDIFGYISILDF